MEERELKAIRKGLKWGKQLPLIIHISNEITDWITIN